MFSAKGPDVEVLDEADDRAVPAPHGEARPDRIFEPHLRGGLLIDDEARGFHDRPGVREVPAFEEREPQRLQVMIVRADERPDRV